jgi:2-keto-3-deoxy-L-rhamnonate aldolase RhmA
MPKLHIELSNTLHAQLVDRAKKNKRFLKDEVIDILEHGMETVLIPVVGKVDANGNITLVNYWETPEGIREIIDRG